MQGTVDPSCPDEPLVCDCLRSDTPHSAGPQLPTRVCIQGTPAPPLGGAARGGAARGGAAREGAARESMQRNDARWLTRRTRAVVPAFARSSLAKEFARRRWIHVDSRSGGIRCFHVISLRCSCVQPRCPPAAATTTAPVLVTSVTTLR